MRPESEASQALELYAGSRHTGVGGKWDSLA